MEPEIYRFPEFFDRLERRGALNTRDAVESETDVDGLVYHHRGAQVPAELATFIWNPEGADDPTFRLEIAAVGPRTAWAEFDARMNWDVYLMLFEGGAVVTWMTDAEFDAEEADEFPSKARAILGGRFSFGTFFLFGPDWVEREEWARSSTAPALIQIGDGRVIDPSSAAEFYDAEEAIPTEFRRDAPQSAPEHLGLVDAGLALEE